MPPEFRKPENDYQSRAFPASLGVEWRDDGAGGKRPHIVGHALVYNSWSVDLGGFKERVMPGAVTKTIDGGDIRGLFNHDPNFILGRTKSGTMTLADEKRGLHFDIDPPDNQTIRDLVVSPIERGDVDQCSFAFQVAADEWREPKKVGGLYERDLLELRLFDVSPVTFPAYENTDVGLRAMLLRGAAFRLGRDSAELGEAMDRIGRGIATKGDLLLLEELVADARTQAGEAGSGELPGAGGGEPAPSGPARAALRRDLEHKLRLAAAL